ncbi:hypothetical protein [Streptomyces sp. NPDC054794]
MSPPAGQPRTGAGASEELVAEIFVAFRAHDRHVLEVNPAVLAAAEPNRAIEAVRDAMSAPDQTGYWRFFFEAYGYAVREPERYREFLDGIVHDWLALVGDQLVTAGITDRERAPALATLTLAAFRGLLLDLVATQTATVRRRGPARWRRRRPRRSRARR